MLCGATSRLRSSPKSIHYLSPGVIDSTRAGTSNVRLVLSGGGVMQTNSLLKLMISTLVATFVSALPLPADAVTLDIFGPAGINGVDGVGGPGTNGAPGGDAIAITP